jgi:hypothetical protein
MDDERSLQSLPPEQTAAGKGASEAVSEVNPEPTAHDAVQDDEVRADSETQGTMETTERDGKEHDGKGNGLPHGSIAAIGERLGQQVAHVSEAAGDKVAHAGEVAGERVHHAGEVAGERVAHAGEAAGQKVILAGEAAEGTVAEAQTRVVHAKRRLVEQAGVMAERLRRSTPTPVREKGARAAEAVRKNRRKAFAGSALVGIAAVVRRRGRRSNDSK